jgi:hypothetical protein
MLKVSEILNYFFSKFFLNLFFKKFEVIIINRQYLILNVNCLYNKNVKNNILI